MSDAPNARPPPRRSAGQHAPCQPSCSSVIGWLHWLASSMLPGSPDITGFPVALAGLMPKGRAHMYDPGRIRRGAAMLGDRATTRVADRGAGGPRSGQGLCHPDAPSLPHASKKGNPAPLAEAPHRLTHGHGDAGSAPEPTARAQGGSRTGLRAWGCGRSPVVLVVRSRPVDPSCRARPPGPRRRVRDAVRAGPARHRPTRSRPGVHVRWLVERPAGPQRAAPGGTTSGRPVPGRQVR